MNEINTNTYTDDFLPEKGVSNVTWFNIYEGMICQRRSRPTDGFTKYESISARSAGKVSYIREFDHMKGIITGFERKDKKTQEGKPYAVAHITFRGPAGQTAIMEHPIKGEWIARFAKCVENMDLRKPVYFRAFLDSKNNTAIYFEQEGEKVEQKYTQENPNGLPQWEKDPLTMEWDTREYWAFLFNIIKTVALPRIQRNADFYAEFDASPDGMVIDTTQAKGAVAGAATAAVNSPTAPAPEPAPPTEPVVIDDDDIPF